MAAYLVVEIVAVHDAEAYARYRSAVSPGLAAAGGRYLARGGAVDVLEGSWKPGRVVIVRFDSPGAARTWWESESYAALRQLRQSCTTGNLIVVDGLPEQSELAQ